MDSGESKCEGDISFFRSFKALVSDGCRSQALAWKPAFRTQSRHIAERELNDTASLTQTSFKGPNSPGCLISAPLD